MQAVPLFPLFIITLHGLAVFSQFKHLPEDIIGNIAIYIRFDSDRQSFASLSRPCHKSIHFHRCASRTALAELCCMIKHVTPHSFPVDYVEIHKIATEFIDIGYAPFYHKLPRLIKGIEQSPLNNRAKLQLYRGLNMNPYGDFVSITQLIPDNKSDEVRLLIGASHRIFQTLRHQYSGDDIHEETSYNDPTFRYFTADRQFGPNDYKFPRWPRCTPPWSIGCALIYQRLIPLFKNLSTDHQQELIGIYQFIPWSTSVVESIKQSHSVSRCVAGWADDDNCFADVVNAANRFTIQSRMIINIYTDIKSSIDRLRDILLEQHLDFAKSEAERHKRMARISVLALSLSLIGVAVAVAIGYRT